MKEFCKSKKLDHVAYDVRGPVLDTATAMEAAGEKILKLNIGNPGAFNFQSPDNIVRAVSDSLVVSEAYSDSKGLLEAREAIVTYSRSKGIEGVTANDVYTGNGVSELISMCMQALLNDGDEILIPSPDYPLWTGAATLSGGKVVHYLCDEKSDWMPDISDMAKKITGRTKAIVVINPNNPTGTVYNLDVLQQITDLAREHGLMLFSDEIYDRLVMDGLQHTSLATLAPDLFVVTMNGLSKSHLLAGYRCGWMMVSGNKGIAKGFIEGLNMLSSMRLCSNVPAQHAILPALEDSASCAAMVAPGGRIFEQRRAICEAMDQIDGLSYVRPRAAFYVFPKLDARRFNITNDEKFVLDFLREKKVLLVHGGGFHWSEPDHFRIVYLPEERLLEQAMANLGDFLKTYRQA